MRLNENKYKTKICEISFIKTAHIQYYLNLLLNHFLKMIKVPSNWNSFHLILSSTTNNSDEA